MRLYIKQVAGLQIPSQANPLDAAYDIVATSAPQIAGEHISRPLDYHGKLYTRIAYVQYETNIFIAPEREEKKTIKTFMTDASGAFCDVQWEYNGVEYHTQLFPRSSISKYNLVLANSVGTVDNGYRGQILLRFKYIFQPEDLVVVDEAGGRKVYGHVNEDLIYKEGDKICQIKAVPNCPIEFVQVDDLPETQRGAGGFGSSGS
jgi:dUTPase